MAMENDTKVKVAVYQYFATTGERPSVTEIAALVGSSFDSILDSYQRLVAQRLLVLEEDGHAIRMASPFLGVPTQHVIEGEGVRYYANCAWDALGVVAALQRPSIVYSRCEQSGEPLIMEAGMDGPGPSDWLFHCHVPAAKWWDDIVFT
jgi:hypothetical protein